MGAVEIDIMPEFEAFSRLIHSGLMRIEFPGVRIKKKGTVCFEHLFHAEFKQGKWDQPEISATAKGDDFPVKSQVTDGQFKEIRVIR